MSQREGIPYIGYTSETLAILPAVVAGESLTCPQCGETHYYRAPNAGDPMLFYHCHGAPYLGAVQYKTAIGYEYRSIIGIGPDVSSGDNARMESKAMCWSCWRDLQGEREPIRLKNAQREPCWRCGALTDAGIYYLVKK